MPFGFLWRLDSALLDQWRHLERRHMRALGWSATARATATSMSMSAQPYQCLGAVSHAGGNHFTELSTLEMTGSWLSSLSGAATKVNTTSPPVAGWQT